MKKVVSFSWGRTSARLAIWAKERFEDCDIVSMDTTAEHKKTYEFGATVDNHFNLKSTVLQLDLSCKLGKRGFRIVDINNLKPDLSVYSAMLERYGVPYIGGMFCNDRMKMVPYKAYCKAKYGAGNYETILGIRIDEPSRYLGENLYRELRKLGYEDNSDFIQIYESMKHDGISGLHGWLYMTHGKVATSKAYKYASKKIATMDKSVLYMAEFLDDDKQDILDFWAKMPFDLDIPEWLGNCVFCPKKSNLKLAAAQRDEPAMYHEFLSMLYSDSVRHDNKTGHWSKMYRGKKSLEQVISMFDGSTGEEIKSRIRGAKMTETGSCSESCEVFVCEANQIDTFK